MAFYAGVPSGDRAQDARANERHSWNRLVEALRRLSDTPIDRADLPRRQYERAKNAWSRAWRQLCKVSP